MIQPMSSHLPAVVTTRPAAPAEANQSVEVAVPQDGLTRCSPGDAPLTYGKFASFGPASPPPEVPSPQAALQLQQDLQDKHNYLATVARNLSHLPGMGSAQQIGTLLTDVYHFSDPTAGRALR